MLLCASILKKYFLSLQEGPHSTLPEDEFFDAFDSGLEKIEEDRQLRARLRLQSQQVKYLFYFKNPQKLCSTKLIIGTKALFKCDFIAK